MKLFVTYADSGPAGITGQVCSITNPQSKLYIIEGTHEVIIKELRSLEEMIAQMRHRKNARLIDCYWDVSPNDEESQYHESDVVYFKSPATTAGEGEA